MTHLGQCNDRCCVMDEVTEDIFRFFYQTREFIDRARSGGMSPQYLHARVTRCQVATMVHHSHHFFVGRHAFW